MDPAAALAQLGGVASARELMAWTTRRRMRTAVRWGSILRLRTGHYGLPGLEAELALRAGGLLAGPSAALAHGWRIKEPPSRPVVLLPSSARHPGPHLKVHWGEAPAIDGITTPARTVVDCARWLPLEEALCVADAALRAGVSVAELGEAVAAAPRTGRSRAGRLIALADPGADNPFETVVRARSLEVEGLSLETQVQIGDARVDLADPALRVVVECDSYGFHGGPEAFARDVRRYTMLVRSGWTVVRIAWADAMHDPFYVTAVLRDVVATRTKEVRPGCAACGA